MLLHFCYLAEAEQGCGELVYKWIQVDSFHIYVKLVFV